MTALLFALLLATIPAIADESAPATRTETRFTTVVTVTVFDPPGPSGEVALDRVFAYLREYETAYAPVTGTALARFENRRSGEVVVCDPDTFAMFEAAARAHRESCGLYDVTVGPFIRAWGFKTDHPGIPSASLLADARARVGFDRLRLDPATRSVAFLAEGMALDLGGLAKGNAIDHAYEILLEAGVRSALIDVGGDIRSLGDHIGLGGLAGIPFTIGINDPLRPGNLFGTLTLGGGKAVATSGDYERFFETDGIRYCHILDPRTGRPGNINRAATVVADSAVAAENLSLTCFLLTAEAALAQSERFGAAALVVDRAGRIVLSPRMAARCSLTAPPAGLSVRDLGLALFFLGIAACFAARRLGRGNPIRRPAADDFS